jgi:hypothetical protein
VIVPLAMVARLVDGRRGKTNIFVVRIDDLYGMMY